LNTTEQEVTAIAQQCWPEREIYVGPNMVGTGEEGPKGYVCYVTDGKGNHAVSPIKGKTLDELRENVYVRVAETAVKEKWPGAQVAVRQRDNSNKWEIVFHGASHLNFEADDVFSLAREAVRRHHNTE
jgi:hypothetical protein